MAMRISGERDDDEHYAARLKLRLDDDSLAVRPRRSSNSKAAKPWRAHCIPAARETSSASSVVLLSSVFAVARAERFA
jgi:hypothetical protein